MKEVKEVVDTVSVALANGQPEEAGNVVLIFGKYRIPFKLNG